MDTTKERILDAALSLMKTLGKDGLTVDAAAELAGVTRKTVYNHFSGRDALVDEASMTWVDKNLAALRSLASDPVLNPPAKLSAVVEYGLSVMRQSGRITRSRRMEAELLAPAAAKRELEQRLSEFISEIVQLAQDAGYIRPEFATSRLTLIIMNIVEGLCLSQRPDDSSY
ncbi:MAG TPA: TetR/AcrR family transcriptional regulator, partial [Spirochaetales bacterium]|nr:TetR/AcrR family transcriptional regulator [Spirochaetales bacterium]